MRCIITILLVAAPFFVGLNRPLAWTLYACLMLVALWKPISSRQAWPGQPTLLLTIAALFALGLPLLQLGAGICSELPSPTPCVAHSEKAWLSLVFALMLLLWVLLLLSPARPRTEQVLIALTLAGGIQAVYALTFFFLDLTPFFLEHTFRHTNAPTGGFTNRNHLAAFLYICIFAAIALILRLPADTGSGRAGRWRLLLDRRMLWRLLIVVMVLALIATRSRAGNAAFLIGLLAGFAWLMLIERRRGQAGAQALRWRFVILVVASVLLLDTLLIGSFVGLDKVQQRIADTSLAGELRFDVNSALLAHPELLTAGGHGAASFLPVFEYAKPPEIPLRFEQAHNDYLQVLVERGWIGALLFAATLLIAGWQVLFQSSQRVGSTEIRFAWLAATVALLVHATVEYVTQMPAIWLAWSTLLVLGLSTRRQRTP